MKNVVNWIFVLDEYFGNSIFVILLLLCFVILIRMRKNDMAKKMLVACIIFMVSYPLVYLMCEKVSLDSVAYRLLWVFPISAVVAMLAMWVVEKSPNKMATWILIVVVSFWLLGNEGLKKNSWIMPQNLYMLDQEIVQIGDIIENDSAEDMITVVGEVQFMIQIRQYSPNVCWGYRRRNYMMNADETKVENASYRVAGAIQNSYYPKDMDILSDLNELGVDYVVIDSKDMFEKYLLEEAYSVVGETDNYRVLRINYN